MLVSRFFIHWHRHFRNKYQLVQGRIFQLQTDMCFNQNALSATWIKLKYRNEKDYYSGFECIVAGKL